MRKIANFGLAACLLLDHTAYPQPGPFLTMMRPPTGATRELGAQTHDTRVALHSGSIVLALGSFRGHLGPFGAVLAPFCPISASRGPFWPFFSSNTAADWCHPGVGGPNLVGMSALGRGSFALSLGPWAIGVPEIA